MTAVQTLNCPDGTNLAYQKIEGKSPGIVFLGGFKSDMTGTKANFLLEHCQRVDQAFVCFDYFGHGLSSGQFMEGTIGHWKNNAINVIDSLTEGPQIIVGSSMGGWIMALVAQERKSRIVGMVGIACAPDFTEDTHLLTEFQKNDLQTKGMCFIQTQYGKEPYPITKQLIAEGKHHRVLNKSIEINCPVRFIHGVRDMDVPWEKSLRLMECFSSEDSLLTLVKNGDHRLNSEEQLKIIGKILRSLSEDYILKTPKTVS